jgi:hypothetical protein
MAAEQKEKEVTLRHAAALALVGWYMMIPPLSRTVRFEVDYGAPLSAWPIMRSFDNAERCEDYRSHELEKYRASAAAAPTNILQTFSNAMLFSQCAASDDPRLKYFPTSPATVVDLEPRGAGCHRFWRVHVYSI